MGIVDEIFPVDQQAVFQAKDIMVGCEGLSAREVWHVAVMMHHGIEEILSFDRAFDGYPGMTRLADQL